MPRIAEMWAWVAVEGGPDDEGVTGFLVAATGQWFPMVGADRERMESLRPMAQAIADETGKTLRLVRFSGRSELEVLHPARKATA